MHDSSHLPGVGDVCLCGRYGPCRCAPEPDPGAFHDAAYERGYAACEAGEDHPLACWPRDPVSAAVARDWRRLASGGSVVGVDGRRFYGSHWFGAPGAWRLRGLYGFDPFRREPCPEDYLAGFEDAMAGLPSAVTDPERHRACAARLDAYEPTLDLDESASGSTPVSAESDDGLPF